MNKAEHQQLDLLINNAGVMMPPPGIPDEGFELQFANREYAVSKLAGLQFAYELDRRLKAIAQH